MSVIHINDPSQLEKLAADNYYVVIDFYADWCGPCTQIKPLYEKFAETTAKPGKVAFTKVNVDKQKKIMAKYEVNVMPTFVLLKQGKELSRIQGANVPKLREAIATIAKEVASLPEDTGSSSATFGNWLGAEMAKGYWDITDQIEKRNVDILNSSSETGSGRVLFEVAPPSSLGSGKGKAKAGGDGGKDWVESDTDEQLMILLPFQSNVKVHSIQITSLPPAADDDDDEAPARPHNIKIYTNTHSILGFEEAEGLDPTQEVALEESDFNSSGTATITTRFVKFQRVSSLVLFIVDAQDGKEKVRVDRIRIIGEAGEKRDIGKLEKLGEGE